MGEATRALLACIVRRCRLRLVAPGDARWRCHLGENQTAADFVLRARAHLRAAIRRPATRDERGIE